MEERVEGGARTAAPDLAEPSPLLNQSVDESCCSCTVHCMNMSVLYSEKCEGEPKIEVLDKCHCGEDKCHCGEDTMKSH